MKKLSFLMAGMLSISLFGGIVGEETIKVVVVKESPKKVYGLYIASIMASGAAGLLSGAITAYAEKRLGTVPGELLSMAMWFMEFELRMGIIGELKDELARHNIVHAKSGMWYGARLASWIGYLAAYAR
jgi:hypothetical protein